MVVFVVDVVVLVVVLVVVVTWVPALNKTTHVVYPSPFPPGGPRITSYGLVMVLFVYKNAFQETLEKTASSTCKKGPPNDPT